MSYIENIVIGRPLVEPKEIFAFNDADWENVEGPKTFFTSERNLAAVLKEIGVVKSISEVRRNKPQLCVTLEDLDFFKIKWGKRFFFVLVGG